MATNVKICTNCKEAFLSDETICPKCNKTLIETNYSSVYWERLSDEDKKIHIEKGSNLTNGIGSIIKSLSLILIFISFIGMLFIIKDVGFIFGFEIFLISLSSYMIFYGIGEILCLLQSIYSKIK